MRRSSPMPFPLDVLAGEALEIASRLEESIASGHATDVNSLARRLVALARHNMIEEERDVFPLARRLL